MKNKFACHMCDTQLSVAVGFYAEGARIRGLGRSHNGPDESDNIWCQCPNQHHVLFDLGAVYVDANWRVRDHRDDGVGLLSRVGGHDVSPDHLKYHRTHFGYGDGRH